ncbi:XRE family transcriptional regulator [Gordonia oryzae]|uniref:XRE family transcriptional regulator n=1 Tax=Gordonia oryzae TaxID=2487349 RepID=A0A3N4G8F6_9ACTN|nr:XRE family transcriptional regulator [Gordonia oryzae]RPA58605.1 XRE family transcriptional regulator [Gordonia oryzae]
MADTHAIARRSGDWWAVEVPSIPGLYTQVRRLEQVADAVQGAATDLGTPVGAVTVEADISDADREALADVRSHLRRLEEIQRETASESRRVALRFREQGLSVRDVGYLMQVSPQRVSQLTAASGDD